MKTISIFSKYSFVIDSYRLKAKNAEILFCLCFYEIIHDNKQWCAVIPIILPKFCFKQKIDPRAKGKRASLTSNQTEVSLD